MIWLLIPFATAAEPGYFHPDKVASASEQFNRYAAELGPNFDKLQSDLGRWGAPVESLERAVLLLGDRAPEALTTYATETRRTLVHQYLTAQAHVSVVEEDSAETFGAAMSAAIAPFESQYALTECGENMNLISLAGPGGRAKARCDGENLNAAIATAMDADAGLSAAVDEMLSLDWPQVKLEGGEQAAVQLTGGDGYLQLSDLAEALDGRVLDGMNTSLEDKLSPVEDRIADGDESALADAEAIRARYELAMAERGGQILDAVAKVLEKEGIAVGVCANPETLGGCPGEDRTREVAPLLVGHKKIEKALR